MLLFTLAGCAAYLSQTEAERLVVADAVEAVDANLARLDALTIVEVGALVNEEAAEAWACYGECPGYDPAAAEAEQERQAVRLARLVDLAEGAAVGPAVPADCEDPAIAENLARLDGLRIVEVGALVEAVPENDPNCYNLPCQDDLEAAEALTCERASALARLAEDAAGL